MATIIELGRMVKSKYPGQYDDLSDIEIGRKVKQKYPGKYDDFVDAPDAPKFEPRKPSSETMPGTRLAQGFASSIRNMTGQNKEGDRVGQAIEDDMAIIKAAQKLPLGSPERTRLLATLKTRDRGHVTEAEIDPGTTLTNREVLGSAGNLGLTAVSGAMAAPKSALARYGQAAVTGATSNVLAGVQDGTAPSQLLNKAFTGAATGTAFTGALDAGSALVKNLAPKVLSTFSNVPQKVVSQSIQNPSAAKAGLVNMKKAADDGDQLLLNVQQKVRGFRENLSKEYGIQANYLGEKFSGSFLNLEDDPKMLKMLNKAADFGLDVPDSGVLDGTDSLAFYKNINEVFTKNPDLARNAEGAPLRAFRDEFRRAMVNVFGGVDGEMDTFLKNYSKQRGIHDSMNDIVRAYNQNKPSVQSAALGRLKNIFKEDRGAYVKAIQDFEAATGEDILDYIAAHNFDKVLPNTMKRLDTSALIGALLSPLTSPRLVGFEARALGRMLKVADKLNMRPALKTLLLQMMADV